MLWHREHAFIVSPAVQSSLKPTKPRQILESVPSPGWVCSGWCNHAWLQLGALLSARPGTPEWHFCVIRGRTVLSWSPSFPVVPFLYSHACTVVVHRDLSGVSLLPSPPRCSAVFPGIHVLCVLQPVRWYRQPGGLDHPVPALGDAKEKSKIHQLLDCYSAAGFGDLQSLVELSLVPDDACCELLGVLPLFQLSPSVPKHSSCCWFPGQGLPNRSELCCDEL